MKMASMILGSLGLLFVVGAVIGRFLHQTTVTFPVVGSFTAVAVLLLGNTLLAAAAWVGVLTLLCAKDKQP